MINQVQNKVNLEVCFEQINTLLTCAEVRQAHVELKLEKLQMQLLNSKIERRKKRR